LAVSAVAGENREERGRGEERAVPQAQQGERHAGPSNYQRPQEPRGWNVRPAQTNRGQYQHNYKAARTYRIGPYHPPGGWMPRHWVYGQILPRPYWAAEYIIADYWLFGLEVPPPGYEWVRDGADAIMVSTVNGEILQVEYGVFA
jgi:Ni/Co efflux regulator RcnB